MTETPQEFNYRTPLALLAAVGGPIAIIYAVWAYLPILIHHQTLPIWERGLAAAIPALLVAAYLLPQVMNAKIVVNGDEITFVSRTGQTRVVHPGEFSVDKVDPAATGRTDSGSLPYTVVSFKAGGTYKIDQRISNYSRLTVALRDRSAKTGDYHHDVV